MCHDIPPCFLDFWRTSSATFSLYFCVSRKRPTSFPLLDSHVWCSVCAQGREEVDRQGLTMLRTLSARLDVTFRIGVVSPRNPRSPKPEDGNCKHSTFDTCTIRMASMPEKGNRLKEGRRRRLRGEHSTRRNRKRGRGLSGCQRKALLRG